MDDQARLLELLSAVELAPELGDVMGPARVRAWLDGGRRLEHASAMHGRGTLGDTLLVALALHDHPGALASLDELLLRAADRCVARLNLSATERAEVAQRLRARLLVPRADGTRSAETYEGRGPLLAWLKVCAAREALMLRRSEAKFDARPLDGERLLTDFGDPELVLLKAADRERLKAAFQLAIAELSPRDKLLLAYQVLDGLGHRQIGALVGLDGSNVCRRLATIRRDLLERASAEFSPEERAALFEMYRLARSHLELSLSRLLRDAADDRPRTPD